MFTRKAVSARPAGLPALLLVATVVAAGCSSSSDPNDTSDQPAADPLDTDPMQADPLEPADVDPVVEDPATVDPVVEDPATVDPVVEDPTTVDPVVEDPATVDPVVEDPATVDPALEDPATVDPVVEDPLIENTTAVTFDITVPAYVSDELRVEILWADMNIVAMAAGDQIWSGFGEFPTDTENPLTVTFFDENGAVELARYSETFRTGSNAAETVQITAEQFDADQFDTDGDGSSNLDELIAGTDPSVDESVSFEIEEFYAISDPDSRWSRMSVSETFESRLTDDRPYSATFDTDTDFGGTHAGLIDIDTDGNGTVSINADSEPARFTPMMSGTRTNNGSSISWTGTRTSSGSDFTHTETITNTVAIVDENTRTLTQQGSGTNIGSADFRWEANAELTGILIEGTSRCMPVAGTFQTTRELREPNLSVITIRVSKALDDEFWRVVIQDDDADNLSASESETREYLVRELRILERPDAPESASFVCDFVDL